MPTPAHLLDEQRERAWKSTVLAVAVALLFVLLILRLGYIQIIQGATNIRLSQENSMQLTVLKATRGRMLDRHGKALAANRPSYAVCVLPYKVKRRSDIVAKLLLIRDETGSAVFDSTHLVAAMRRANSHRFDPTPIKEDASMELVSIIEEHASELPGVVVETEARREYPLAAGSFHVLGYMGEIPETQFDSLQNAGYAYGDLIGKSGLEKQYENELRGVSGQQYVEVNAYGKVMGAIDDMPRIDPVAGYDAMLTIDADLQKVASDSFSDTLKGAVVVIDPRNGEVLVMFSSPGVDPNIFSYAADVRNAAWAVAARDPNLPLNNRVTAGTYSPGSTFKLISAIAGLSSGRLQRDSHMPQACRGSYRIGNRIAKCWIYPRGHGSFGLIDAIQQSCNVYFYQVGLAVGDKTINSYAQMLGLGSVTGIDLPQEKEGWLSGEDAYNKRFAPRHWKWTAGLVLDLAIGQAQVATPLQLALMVGGLGNGKHIYTPHLIKEFRDAGGNVVKKFDPRIAHTITVPPLALAAIHEAMLAVVEPGGTGGRARVPGIPVGGKTGSAQNPQGDLTHALFVACAPLDSPVIAIGVVVENAGHGGSIAGPIAGSVLRYYFQHTSEGREVSARYGVTYASDSLVQTDSLTSTRSEGVVTPPPAPQRQSPPENAHIDSNGVDE